jgi:hypothetical protein
MNKTLTAAALLAALVAAPAMAQTAGSAGAGAAASGPATSAGPNANDKSSPAGMRSAANVDVTSGTGLPVTNGTAPVATVSGGSVVVAGTSMGAGGTVSYTTHYVNVPANVTSRADFQRWTRLK